MQNTSAELLSSPRISLQASEPRGSEALRSACQEMVSRALDFCGQKIRAREHPVVVRALQSGSPTAHEYFRYALSKELGGYLGKATSVVKTVYLYEPNGLPGEVTDEEPDSRAKGLTLIVWVTEQQEGLQYLARELGDALLQQYVALIGPSVEQMTDFLTVDIITDRDVDSRSGSGALVASLHTRPIKVWSRFVIKLNAEHCGMCHICATVCPFDAIRISPGATAAKIDLDKCQLCGLCYSACPAGAIESAYYDLAELTRDVQASARANGWHSIALTCRGSTPTANEIEAILGEPGFTPICLPCVGRTPPEFFLKALSMGVERIAVIPCKDDHCRFEDGSKVIRNRILLIRSLLQQLNYDPSLLLFREADGPQALVNPDLCTGCGTCLGLCPYAAIRAEVQPGKVLFVAQVDASLCQGCGVCAVGCPSRAIDMSRFANPEILTQIEACLAGELQDGARIVGFRCNWCSYTDADLPSDGFPLTSQGIEVIRVPCVGRIDPLHILWAFLNGADGVFLGGCPPDECRYRKGSSQAEQRLSALYTLLDACGFDPRRLRMDWIRRSNPDALGDAIGLFAQEIRQLHTSRK